MKIQIILGSVIALLIFVVYVAFAFNQYERTISDQNTAITVYKTNEDNYKLAITAKDDELKRRDKDLAKEREFKFKLELQQDHANKQLSKLTSEINDKDKAVRLKALANGRKASLLVRIINKDSVCEYVDHFWDIGKGLGECRAGKYIKTNK